MCKPSWHKKQPIASPLVTILRETVLTAQAKVLVGRMGEFIFERLSPTHQRIFPYGVNLPQYTLPGVLHILGYRSISCLSSKRDALGWEGTGEPCGHEWGLSDHTLVGGDKDALWPKSSQAVLSIVSSRPHPWACPHKLKFSHNPVKSILVDSLTCFHPPGGCLPSGRILLCQFSKEWPHPLSHFPSADIFHLPPWL